MYLVFLNMNRECCFEVVGDTFCDLIYTGSEVINKGEIVLILEGDILDYPTRTSIHIGKDQHIEDDIGKYINHACDPTCRVENSTLVAVKQINHGDSITFDYNDSEVLMSDPFECNCCTKPIRGSYFKSE